MDIIRISDSNRESSKLLFETQDVRLRDRILLSPYTKFLLPSLLFAFVIPFTVYAVMVNGYLAESSFSVATCNLRPEYYVDCLPGRNATRNECNAVLCCWNDAYNFCYHTVPAQHGYTPAEGVYYQGATLIPREIDSPLGSPNAEGVRLDVTAVDYNHLKISLSTGSRVSARRMGGDEPFVRDKRSPDEEQILEDELTRSLLDFLPRDRRRRTVPIELENSPRLNAYVHYPEFSVTVARDDYTVNEGSLILSTARGPLILTENYWEWTLYVNNGSLYGLNDLELNGTTNSIYNNENGTITPAFLAISQSGEGAAYYVDYKGPLEVQVLNVSNLVILRGLAIPENLAIHVFAGPTPVEAVQQLTAALAASGSINSTSIPPSRNYGLHVCPAGTMNPLDEVVAELNATVETLDAIDAPWDSHCLHERLVSVLNHVLTADELESVSAASELLEEGGRGFTPHLSPTILADGGTTHIAFEESALVLSNGSAAYLGLYHETSVVYPSWESDDTRTIAATYLQDYLIEIGSPASLWIRDAWPKNELNSSSGPGVDFTMFDYMPKEMEFAMSSRTVPHDLLSPSGKFHFATHNNYSRAFGTFVRPSIPTVEFIGPPGESANTSWSGLRRAVRSAVGAGLVGDLPPPMYVCGTGNFNVTIHDQLCIRWYQAAVTWPYIVVLPDRLPGSSLLSTSASLTIAKILKFRASLATYQHTVVASHFQRNSPVLAPTSLYYPEDESLTHTSQQFMWGEALLVGLVTLPGVSQVPMRLPGDLPWRHLMGGAEAVPISNGITIVTATVGQLITLVRPGRIVPVHKDVATTTAETILRNFSLAVNLQCDESCSATGEIFYGSNVGEYLSLEINGTHLFLGNVNGCQTVACDNFAATQSTFIETVELLGNTSYTVNTELCELGESSFVISLI